MLLLPCFEARGEICKMKAKAWGGHLSEAVGDLGASLWLLLQSALACCLFWLLCVHVNLRRNIALLFQKMSYWLGIKQKVSGNMQRNIADFALKKGKDIM